MTNLTSQQYSRLQSRQPFTRAEADNQLVAIGLYWDRQAQPIICATCMYALHTKGERVSRHLGEKHQVSVQARAGQNAFVAQLGLPDPNQLDLRPDWAAPYPYLAVQDGASCKRCHFRSTSLELVKRHVSKTHCRISKQENWLKDYIHVGAQLQSWTQYGTRGYWIVKGRDGLADTANASLCQLREVTAMHREEEDRLTSQLHNRSTTDVGIDDPTLCSSWMRRTGWQTTYRDVNRRLALQLREPPAADGEALYLGSFGGTELYSSADD